MATLEKSLRRAMSGVGYTEVDLTRITTQESRDITFRDFLESLLSANVGYSWIITFIDGRFIRVTKKSSDTIGRTLPRDK